MTRDDIIKAAFKVWGRELYKTTSLTEIAQELGVSKTALYRHFKDKDALLEAMYPAFFDECAAFIKNGCDTAAKAASTEEAHLVLMRTFAEYYVRNKDAFIFSLIRVYNNQNRHNVTEEFMGRGIIFENLLRIKVQGPSYPSAMQLIVATMVFCVAEFHRKRGKTDETTPDKTVECVLAQIEERVEKGLKLNAAKIAGLDYERLEKQAGRITCEETEDNALLKAVAEAVAEAGPWDASMEMVARNSGLSKSGLYAHFKNKKDMLSQLFITEFRRIVNFAKAQIETSEASEEQLYLAIISIVYYLRSRPEILVGIDWIKTRSLELETGVPTLIFRTIESFKLEAIKKLDQHMLVDIAQWVLFMIVNTLAWWPLAPDGDWAGRKIIWAKNTQEIPNESFRSLFRFIALGSEGLNI